MLTLVIDTSVVISALIGSAGPSRQVLRHCLLGHYQPVISTALFLEYEAVQQRPHIQERCPLSDAEVRGLLNAFYRRCTWVPIHYLWRPNLQGESDNFLIELAVASNADGIVTNNIRDLTSAELIFPGLRVLKPEQLLRGE